jgi:hypothetical protein
MVSKVFPFFVAIGILCLSLEGYAGVPKTETSHIHGKIIDATTGEALTGVLVKLEGFDQGTLSDESGNFTIDYCADNPKTLTLSLVSFQTISLSLADLSAVSTIALHEKP